MLRRQALGLLAAAPFARSDSFLEDLSHRAFLLFWEQADRSTGLVMDRARNDGTREPSARNIASIAATGFGLTALCIGAEREWISRDEAAERVRSTLHSFAERIAHKEGWFYHFLDATTGERVWNCELSSIDTTLLLAGVLTARQYFSGDPGIARTASAIYERVNFQWMLNGSRDVLSQGWKPESGFLPSRWDRICEASILYLLAIGSTTHPIFPGSWYAWERTRVKYGDYSFVSGGPLFTHQYTQAWVDLRGLSDQPPSNLNYFDNSITATRANRAFCIDLGRKFPKSYSPDIWGITASDGEHGYSAWGNPPERDHIDGTVVPGAAGGSLMLLPEPCLATLHAMKERFGKRIWGRYGFCDAFNPTTGWVDPDVLGIDQGITLLSAENLRSGGVWTWFMRNPEIRASMRLAGFH